MGFLLHVGAAVHCPHGGSVSISFTNPRVMVSGQPVAKLSDPSFVSGCSFMVEGKMQPCVFVQWDLPANRVRVNGKQALLQTSTGFCQTVEHLSGGTAVIFSTQARVKGI
jgi:hypothetical protein